MPQERQRFRLRISNWASLLAILFPALVMFPAPALAQWKAARAQFLQAVAQDDDAQKLIALETVGRFDNADVAQLLVRHGLTQQDMLVHREVFRILSRLTDEKGRKLVIDACRRERNWEIRVGSIYVIASYGGDYVYSKLVEALEDKKWQVRSAAVRAMAQVRKKESISVLIDRLKAEEGRVRWDLRWALQNLTGERIEPDFKAWFHWWTTNETDFKMLSSAEAEKKLSSDAEEEKKDLKTAVREGLYGPIYGERIAFLLDVSGSMTVGADDTATRIQIAKQELSKVLENQISPNTYFNIITFAEEVRPFQRGLTRAKEKNIKKALKYIDTIRAGGETNAYGALEAAFKDPDVDTIYLLSDGQPTVGEETIPEIIFQKVDELNRTRQIAINCIGFFPGFAKNQNKKEARDFLRRLALENEGTYKEIF